MGGDVDSTKNRLTTQKAELTAELERMAAPPEETGNISLAVGGRLEKNLSPEQLTGRLEALTQARAPA